ncbi:DUF4259 domain-containing protein [Flavivirga algicola]|uniref:DUF4259 domain-containing protein n=1 Tax=Flavivirga algicola TaxID=2729136 RepID=A0ABX1RWN5_9FLAO|nr:DUF4259 domain-containing protein [Flavivirga algicola]NMH87977.1 DUF4259 domain-containing protein [Flavivirga algicola]
MGNWGIKALESDNGLDFIGFLEEFYAEKLELSLSEIITILIKADFLSDDRNNIDYLYDNTAISLAELFLMFKEKGELDYDNEDERVSLRKKTQFKSDKESIEFTLQYLTDIKNEKPDEDGEREFVELWKESDSYDKWQEHLNGLITGLKQNIM